MVEKEVTVKVGTEVDAKEVEALEKRVHALKSQRLKAKVEADSKELEETKKKIETVKKELSDLKSKPDVDDSEVKALEDELSALENKALNLEVEVATGELKSAKELADSLTTTEEVKIDVDQGELESAKENVSNLESRLMGLAGTIGMVDQATQMWEASTQRQTTQFYLGAQLGEAEAKKMQGEIQNIVAAVPGDDTFMNAVLSGSLAKQTDLTTDELKTQAQVMADYIMGSEMQGKNALEAQQDLKSYILSGSTAELANSSILSNQIDILKDKKTIQERILALQEAEENEKVAGVSGYETASNKLTEFQGQLEKSRADLGDIFLPVEQSALETALSINDQLGGGLTNAIVGLGMAIPTLVSGITVIGEFARGLSALSDGWDLLKDKLGNIKDKVTGLGDKFSSAKQKIGDAVGSMKDKLSTLKDKVVSAGNAAKTAALKFIDFSKTLITNAISAAKNAATSFASLAKEVLLSGYNALKSAAMWVVEKASLVASTIATYAAEAAQWALNVAMSANPIGIIIVAIVALIAVLGYLYFNNETVRNAINNLGQTFVQIGQIIYSAMINAVNWVIGALQNLWNYIITLGGLLPANVSITGNNIIDTVLRVVAFIATLPLQIGIIFTNIIAKALGFGNNFAQRMFTAAQNSVTRFASQIKQLPGKLATELQNMLSAVSKWAATLPQKFWDAGVEAVQKFLSALGIASPGTMQRMLIWEISEMGRKVPLEGDKLVSNIGALGDDIIEEFGNPRLGLNMETMNTSMSGNAGVGNNINLHVEVGTVDSTDRVNEIVDAVRRELSWNNTTAGRTV